ncbi:uncharacterized protein L969DRAFT_96396 [Mixia osmundae IAM 14324]|uniref:Serine aminopeptidase S33 domain-containing protein n=1 Tax=Mixia osmundae (strain CBS 9802 / IAM 14324 / JCM 22182 / KY 12970) TaxID=764103 RepID=G7DX68_MIXOS|nr:uncharacterized protein L969DRAFT_96396 [Mixia osmundae IAM 14324]KEI37314.1 hypothetical protein L969DRAFT_96396 [Mixia osmundae IAM 14324]GAA95178.1 hypothetical protein E5Q_01833 [Mixia osmundae IAM 14324]
MTSAWIKGPTGVELYTKTWTVDKPKAYLVFVHGFMEHVNRYDHVFEAFAKRGIQTFAWDQQGFGQTAAKTNTQGITSFAKQLDDVDYFVNETAGKLTDNAKLFLMGHSMGGCLVATYATQKPAFSGLSKINGGMIVSSPLIEQPKKVAAPMLAVRAGSIIGRLLPSLQMKVGVPSNDICRDPAVCKAYKEDPLCPPMGCYRGVADMLLGGKALLESRYADWPKTLPTLFVHGSGDLVCECSSTEKLVEKIKADDKHIQIFDGYYHEMHNDGEDKWPYIAYLGDWIEKHAYVTIDGYVRYESALALRHIDAEQRWSNGLLLMDCKQGQCVAPVAGA